MFRCNKEGEDTADTAESENADTFAQGEASAETTEAETANSGNAALPIAVIAAVLLLGMGGCLYLQKKKKAGADATKEQK